MSNRTYICTKCRTARRAEAAGGLETSLRCSSCGGPLWELSHRWRIPKKTDDKAWLELKSKVDEEQPVRKERLQQVGTDLLRKIGSRIEAISAQKGSQRRETAVKKLQRERTEIQLRYFPRTPAHD